jgi:predicted sulfurtransferase
MFKKQFSTIIIFASIFVLAGCFQNVTSDKSAPRITKEELKSTLGNPEVIVVDVRLSDEWKKSEWKIKGAVREDPEKFKSWAGNYPRDKTLVFY